MSGHGRGHQRTRSKATNGNAGDEASAIWKPFHQNGDGHDVTKAQPNSADDAVGQVQPPQFVVGETRQKNSHAIKKAARHRNNSRSLTIEPEAAEKSRDTQHKDADGKSQRDFGNAPAELLRQGHAENAPRVNRAQRNL